ncbi:MAG: ABC transporter permease [Vicinamibacterales bacterium]
MLANLQHLFRYRGLIQSLVARDLKARYRGSLLGFFWSFVNPLLLLLIYTFVFTVVMPGARGSGLEPFAVFMFCGILPWTWFSSTLLESSNVLVSGGNLIKKVLFPAEVLPIVTVLAGLVNFCLGLPVLAAFLIYYRVKVYPLDLLWLPVLMVLQCLLTMGLAFVVSSLTVLFRDVKDLLANLLTLWFFATPIIYPFWSLPASVRRLLGLNPMTYLVVSYQEVLFREGPYSDWTHVLIVAATSLVVFFGGYFVFNRLRDTLAEEI